MGIDTECFLLLNSLMSVVIPPNKSKAVCSLHTEMMLSAQKA